ncbi:hypothetical protein niasHS_002539 [Heterodera schachtii]|uniref:Uncharacterized protein n=1 Tax=Heterodera schachtii TaxID=97005 RepID=A0ABD2KK96_HETSC
MNSNSKASSPLGTAIALATAGAVVTIQSAIIAILYRKCAKLTQIIHNLQTENSNTSHSLRNELVLLRRTVLLLERRIAQSEANRTEMAKTEKDERLDRHEMCEEQKVIGRVASANSASEGEYADAVDDDPDFFKMSSKTNGTKVCSAVADSKFLEQIDRLHETGKHSEAYAELMKANREEPEVLWRLARVCHQMASSLELRDPRKRELLDEAHRYATSAYELRGTEFNVLKWMAAVTGSRTDFLGTKEKIEQGNRFKELLDKALAINPTETTLLHMRGRLAYSVAGLSWLERKAAAALFGNPPEATYDDAIADFLLVAQHKPEWAENLMFLGKAYLARGDKKNALSYLEKAVAENSAGDENEEDESEWLKEAKQLVKKLGK